MSEHDIELLKLQIQREIKKDEIASKERAAVREFWRWMIMYVVAGLGPVTSFATAYVNNRAISTAADKADVAADKAAVVERTVTTELLPAATVSAAINTEWKAGRTGNPEDKVKAEKAAAKAEDVAVKNFNP